MILDLQIKNFVIIDNLRINFDQGLNILSGETGAGKSILIGAISAILGEKVSIDSIRTGCESATIEATFDIEDLTELKKVLSESGIECEDNILIIRRDLFVNGKGRCYINSSQVPVSKLKEFAGFLIDIHGQNEQQTITKTSKHRELLDSFASLSEEVAAVKEIYDKLQSIRNKINSYQIDEREKARLIEFNSFSIKEIESANLKEGEEEELQNESNLLANSEKIFKEINISSELLTGDGGVLERLKKTENSLSNISTIDGEIATLLDAIRESLYSLEDSAKIIKSFSSSIDFSQERINLVEERLSLIQQLKKKYGDSIEEILQYLDKAREELDSISSSEEELEDLKKAETETVQEAKKRALLLSAKRKESAKKLEKMVSDQLKDLAMADTDFKVNIEYEIDAQGDIESENKRYILYPHGLDKIEFFISANKGENLRQLRKVASGGEMSRLMLALKNVILSADIVDTLIFDEVDTGISGKTAEIVGKKLKSLSGQKQVLLITHLPQIAAMSDSHFLVEKHTEGDRTTSSIAKLNPKEKVREVARMLAGEEITETSIKHAEELISKQN